jgi:hypothetical protein
VWKQTAKLNPSDGAPHAKFGQSVSLDADTAFVGAMVGTYVFERIDGVWTQSATLGLAGTGAVSVNDGVGIVGSPGAPFPPFIGSVHFVERIEGKWALVATFDGWWQLGQSVSIDADIAIAGLPATVFRRVDGIWMESAHLDNNGVGIGHSVSINGLNALVGAPYPDGIGLDSGAAFIFDVGCACIADCNADGALNILDFVCYAQARTCASVGAGKRLRNHPATAGWKPEKGSGDIRPFWPHGWLRSRARWSHWRGPGGDLVAQVFWP